MHEVLVNRLGGLSLPRKSVVRLTDRPDMTLDVYRGRKTTMQQCNITEALYDEYQPNSSPVTIAITVSVTFKILHKYSEMSWNLHAIFDIELMQF